MTGEAEPLDAATRCMLGFRGDRGPLAAPMAFWFDGSSLWMTPAIDSVDVAALRDGACVAYVPPVGGARRGAIVVGHARVHGLHDLLGLATHAAPLFAAMTVLAVRNAATVLGYVGYVQDAGRAAARSLPRNPVALRVTVERLRAVAAPDLGRGVAPALPTVVPADVRRALAGRRAGALITDVPEGLDIGPVVCGAGFALTVPRDRRLSPGTPAVATVEHQAQRAGSAAGVALGGRIGGGAELRVERVTWWHGFASHTVDVPAATAAITLPE